MNPFAGLMAPMVDRPCVGTNERRRASPPAVQFPPRLDLPAVANPWKLTPMQYAVMGLLTQGHGKKATGDKLGINAKTVDSHLERILTKMDVATRGDALDLFGRWKGTRP